MTHGNRRASGFTLIEMATVLAVLGILAMAVAPDVINALEATQASRVAEDVRQIVDSSRWYFQDKAAFDAAAPVKVDPRDATWPGQTNANDCAGDKTVLAFTELAKGYLRLDNDFRNTVIPLNPWNEPYLIGYTSVASNDPGHPHCLLLIATEIPAELQSNFQRILPAVECIPGVRPNFLRCTASITKPGAQASISYRYFKRYP
jgi:prepilin-type N-terminal cleavage/methylation domain-containing protein